MPPRADQDLRRMVVDLAALRPDDTEAILAELTGEQRKAVEGLLQEFSGFGFSVPMRAGESGAYDMARISPWLIQRIERADTNMTAEARGALRAVAIEALPAAPKTASRAPARRGLFGSGKREP